VTRERHRDDAASSASRPTAAIIGTRGYPSYYGGFETLIRTLAPYLVEHGWDVTVYGRAGATKPDDPHRHPDVRTVDTAGRESKSLSTLSYGLTSSLHAAARRPDVALVMNVANGYWLPLLKACGVPTVLNVDGIEWQRQKWGRLAKAVFRGGARMSGRWADVLVYDAQAIRRHWEREFGRSGVVIEYGGDFPGELPVPDGLTHRGYALLVARFVPENTVPEFLDAAAELGGTTDVVLVGTSGYGGPLDQRAATLAAANPRVRWLGHLSDDRQLFALWQHAGAYFHGQSVGGTNPALVQAMACGAPIVARDTVYNREVLDEAGIFVQPTAESIRQGVVSVLSDPSLQDRLTAQALGRARSHYTWERICRLYEETLRQAIRDRHRDDDHDAIPQR
jgi:glycosyltransferase involved in cell wall biosynthesis